MKLPLTVCLIEEYTRLSNFIFSTLPAVFHGINKKIAHPVRNFVKLPYHPAFLLGSPRLLGSSEIVPPLTQGVFLKLWGTPTFFLTQTKYEHSKTLHT